MNFRIPTVLQGTSSSTKRNLFMAETSAYSKFGENLTNMSILRSHGLLRSFLKNAMDCL